jgi:DNA-binding CsgD family transcriptional regulator
VAAFKQLLGSLGRARDARALKLCLVDRLSEPFGAFASGVYLFDGSGALSEVYARGVRDRFLVVYEEMGRGSDPILERALRTGAAAHDQDVFSADGWRRSELYRECGGPWQIQHYLCVPIHVGAQLVGTINLGRRSAEHPFRARDVGRVMEVARTIGVRLEALSGDVEPAPAARPTIEEIGRTRAERTRVRLHATELERNATPLDDAQVAALWEAVASRRLAPLDCFDQGDRHYVLLPSSPSAAEAPRRPLAPREMEVVRLAALGLANKEIAFELGISINTVGTTLLSAVRKLGVGSRVKLVELARRIGLAREGAQPTSEGPSAASSARERTPSLRNTLAT